MDLIANDLSIHRQFRDPSSFRSSFAGLIAMRQVAKHWERDIYCSRRMVLTEPMSGVPMSKAVAKYLSEAERRAVMAWLTRGGPFWEDEHRHRGDEWLECCGDIVTDSAVGEAACRHHNGVPTGLISVTPSKWTASPVSVVCRNEDEHTVRWSADVQNWWEVAALEMALEGAAPPLSSWHQLRETAVRRFRRLRFSEECFTPLQGVPFAKGAADRVALCFAILNRLAGCFGKDRARTPEGQRIYEQYFMGDKALFSGSSEKEKQKYRQQLTFPHPAKPGEMLFCPWHGKMSRHLIRLHFSWPIRADEPVYIMYVGRKITTR